MSFQPTIQIAAFGESTYRGVNSENAQPNQFCVPDMVASTLGVGLNQPISKVTNKAVSGRSFPEQRQIVVQDKVTLEIVNGPLQDSKIVSTKGNLVLLNIGINDAWNGTSVEAFKGYIRSFVVVCRTVGKFVIVQSPNQISTTEPYIDGSLLKDGLTVAQRLGHFSTAISSLSSELDFIYVDSHAHFGFPRGEGDPWHPTNIGYGILRDDLLSVVSESLVNKLNAQFQVSIMYTSILGRVPEKSGMDWWVGHILAGDVGFGNRTLVSSFLESAEGGLRFPAASSDRDFVKAVYSKILGRHSTTAEEDYWITEITNSTRANALTIIIHTVSTYSVRISSGADPISVKSEWLLLNRAALGITHAVNLGREFVDSPLPSGKLAQITNDPLSVLSAGQTL